MMKTIYNHFLRTSKAVEILQNIQFDANIKLVYHPCQHYQTTGPASLYTWLRIPSGLTTLTLTQLLNMLYSGYQSHTPSNNFFLLWKWVLVDVNQMFPWQ